MRVVQQIGDAVERFFARHLSAVARASVRALT
jgi:hypothetical protein